MQEPIRSLPFPYRLPADVAARIHGTSTDISVVEGGSPRRTERGLVVNEDPAVPITLPRAADP